MVSPSRVLSLLRSGLDSRPVKCSGACDIYGHILWTQFYFWNVVGILWPDAWTAHAAQAGPKYDIETQCTIKSNARNVFFFFYMYI